MRIGVARYIYIDQKLSNYFTQQYIYKHNFNTT